VCSVFIIILLIIVLTPIVVYLSLVAVGAILIVADPIEPVDAVVILSGDSGDRLGMAAELLERGHVQNLVITNTDRMANRRLERQARAKGFERDRIYITDLEVDSTLDEALAVLHLAQDQGWSDLMVVTDPYHSFRTRLIFRRELRGSGVSIHVRPVVGHWFQASNWFLQREGWNVVFLEIAKLFNYLLFHT
jgi:uncharacterized SAM-binding protein YcdF (DUF218 family)